MSRPIASFTAWARACSVPRYRSVVWIEAIAFGFLDGDVQAVERGVESFGRVGIELGQEFFKFLCRRRGGLALPDHGDADDDLGVIVAFFIFPDIDCP